MKILALDTSTSLCSLAISENDQILASRQSSEAFAHNGLLFEMLEQLLAECKLTLKEIDLLAVGQGPGSFTGLRIGVSAWKALAFAGSIPLLPICPLKAVALMQADKVKDGEYIRVFIDARQSDAFTALYKIENQLPIVIDPVKVVERSIISSINDYALACGNLPTDCFNAKNYLPEIFPQAAAIARLAYLERENPKADKFFEPSYYKEFKLHVKQ